MKDELKRCKGNFVIEANEEEYSSSLDIAANAPKFTIPRNQKKLTDKIHNSVWRLEGWFMNEQKARLNSEYTIKHYQRTFNKLYEFFSFNYLDEYEDLEKIYNDYENNYSVNPLRETGKFFPLAVLEDDKIVGDFIDYLKNIEGVGEQTVNSYLRDFRAIMYYAMENGWVKHYKITIKNREPDIKICYSESEIKRLIKKPDIDNFTEYRNWVIINYILATGNRIQTIINIKVGDVDLDECCININNQKSGKVNRIQLVKSIIPILKEYIYSYRTNEETNLPYYDDYLFPNRFGEKLTDNALKKTIANYNKSRGVEKTSIHLFRHTFAKKWIMSGGDIVSLQKMLGQSSLRMVQYYSNLYGKDVKEKAEDYALLNTMKRTSGKTLQRRK